MNIAMLALGSRGDIQPYLALGEGLRTAGHRVRFATFENFAAMVAEHHLDFISIHGDARSLVANAGAEMFALVRSFGSLAEGYARDVSEAMPALQDTQLLINQLPLGLYGYDLAEKLGIPMLAASVIPLVRTRALPVMGFPALPIPGYHRFTFLLAEQMAWQMFRAVINRWRVQSLGLHPVPFLGYADQIGTRQCPVLNGFSAHVVPRPIDWGEDVHITGYWFPQDDTWQPPDSLRAFLKAGAPPVFIGFGSMPVRDVTHTTEIVLDAIKASGQRVILHSGWAGIGLTDLPKNIFIIDYAPYGWLFPRMAMTIHHGGSGTTGFGLRSGVPSLAAPFVFDQFYWGNRILDLGVGPKPIPFKQLSVERLAEAIGSSMNDSQMRQRAAELGRKIQAERGIENAMEIIERYR